MSWHHTDAIPVPTPAVYYVTADRAHIPDHYGYAYCRSNRPFRVSHDVPARVTEPGWVEVAAGWTTGDWGDAIADRKQDFNAWAESVITGDVVPDHPVWIITDPTSNVFSTAVSVWVPDQYADKASIPEGL